MTDRGRTALRQTEHRFTVGPSSLVWDNDRLVIHIDEFGAPPLFGRLRGTVTLRPAAVTSVELPLCADGGHVWRPFAPVSDISVALESKGWHWDGHGYFDANFGVRALEADFDYWTWGRYPTVDGSTCFYDAERRDGSTLASAVAFDQTGRAREIDAPPTVSFRRNLWAVRRETRADKGASPRQVKAMLDAPFYARAMVETQIGGQATIGVHEALDLRRFRSPFLMPMLACRVPRRAGWSFAD